MGMYFVVSMVAARHVEPGLKIHKVIFLARPKAAVPTSC